MMWLVICAFPNNLFGDLNQALTQFPGEKYLIVSRHSEPKTSDVFIRFDHYPDGECIQQWAHKRSLATRSANSNAAIHAAEGK